MFVGGVTTLVLELCDFVVYLFVTMPNGKKAKCAKIFDNNKTIANYMSGSLNLFNL